MSSTPWDSISGECADWADWAADDEKKPVGCQFMTLASKVSILLSTAPAALTKALGWAVAGVMVGAATAGMDDSALAAPGCCIA